MTELFELIASRPLEFLAGLGVSSTAIYSICALLRFLVDLITKKKKKRKEIFQQNEIASAVINKLSSAEQFLDILVARLIEALDKSQFKKLLEDVAKKENCPIELKAYIETVLGQVGNEDLLLLYEQSKSLLISEAKDSVEKTILKGEIAFEEEKTVKEDENETDKREPDCLVEEEQKVDEVEIDYA